MGYTRTPICASDWPDTLSQVHREGFPHPHLHRWSHMTAGGDPYLCFLIWFCLCLSVSKPKLLKGSSVRKYILLTFSHAPGSYALVYPLY